MSDVETILLPKIPPRVDFHQRRTLVLLDKEHVRMEGGEDDLERDNFFLFWSGSIYSNVDPNNRKPPGARGEDRSLPPEDQIIANFKFMDDGSEADYQELLRRSYKEPDFNRKRKTGAEIKAMGPTYTQKGTNLNKHETDQLIFLNDEGALSDTVAELEGAYDKSRDLVSSYPLSAPGSGRNRMAGIKVCEEGSFVQIKIVINKTGSSEPIDGDYFNTVEIPWQVWVRKGKTYLSLLEKRMTFLMEDRLESSAWFSMDKKDEEILKKKLVSVLEKRIEGELERCRDAKVAKQKVAGALKGLDWVATMADVLRSASCYGTTAWQGVSVSRLSCLLSYVLKNPEKTSLGKELTLAIVENHFDGPTAKKTRAS